MKQAKSSNPMPQASPSLDEATRWFWHSDLDPSKEKDSTKWSWEAYPYDKCQIIEKAFISNEPTVDLGDYEIDLNKMIQVNKTYRNKIRTVRREIYNRRRSRFLEELPQPSLVRKDQKTVNDAFGNVDHFLNYIMKRTPEAYKLFERLKALTLDCTENEYKDILEAVVSCILKGAETREKMTVTRAGTVAFVPNFIWEARCIINEIRSEPRTLRDFLKLILRIYTRESFICYWLNELLRSENWEEVNVLTPYLVCLAYTFKFEEYIIKYEEPKNFAGKFLALVSKQTMVLYRGTALTREHLEYYDPKKNDYFSWNGVTSTSRSKVQATLFVQNSLKRAKEQNDAKVGVIFKIEVDFASPRDCEGIIDISADSVYPQEQEVILAPGSVFKIISLEVKKNGIYKVNLKLRKEFDENSQDVVSLLGNLQNKVILQDKVILDDLGEDEIIKAFILLVGNQLVRTVEIKNCVLTGDLIHRLSEMRKTTNIKKKDVVLRSNKITVDSLSFLCAHFSPENTSDIFTYNNVIFDSESNKFSRSKLKKLSLGKKTLKMLYKKDRLDVLYRAVDHGTDLTSVNLAIADLAISETDLIHLIDSIKTLTSVRSISLDFSNASSISDEGLSHLKATLISLASIEYIALSFERCLRITDKGICEINSAIESSKALSHLSVNFCGCNKVSDSQLNNLGDSLKSLRLLQHLSLNFVGCNKVSDDALNSLKDSAKSLTSLQHFSLNYSHWLDFSHGLSDSNERLSHIKDSLIRLTSAQYVTVNLGACAKITPEELHEIIIGIQACRTLLHLSLDFSDCIDLSNESLDTLRDSLGSLTSLKHLSLSFSNCEKISDGGLDSLRDLLKSLTSLQHLCLDFFRCYEISDDGLDSLRDSLSSLTSLQHLSLNFTGCNEISNNELGSFIDSLKPLISLQSLSLNFTGCHKISDGVLEKLRRLLKLLISLQSLFLDFSWCSKISDGGLGSLRGSVKSLKLLQYLSLNFTGCNKISNGELGRIKRSIKLLASLRYLSLDFSWCVKISDSMIDDLRDLWKAFKWLQVFELNKRKQGQIK